MPTLTPVCLAHAGVFFVSVKHTVWSLCLVIRDIIDRRQKLPTFFNEVKAIRRGDAIGERFARLCRDCGFDDPGYVFHSLRKWQATALFRAGVPEEMRERIQGRTPGTLGSRTYVVGLGPQDFLRALESVQLPSPL